MTFSNDVPSAPFLADDATGPPQKVTPQRMTEISREIQDAMRRRDTTKLRALMAERDGTPLDPPPFAAPAQFAPPGQQTGAPGDFSAPPGQQTGTPAPVGGTNYLIQPGNGLCEMAGESGGSCTAAIATTCTRCSRRICMQHRRFWMGNVLCTNCQQLAMNDGNQPAFGVPVAFGGMGCNVQ